MASPPAPGSRNDEASTHNAMSITHYTYPGPPAPKRPRTEIAHLFAKPLWKACEATGNSPASMLEGRAPKDDIGLAVYYARHSTDINCAELARILRTNHQQVSALSRRGERRARSLQYQIK